MIEIVTPNEYGFYTRELREMHRLRHRVFKERLGWDVKSVNGEERDEFDDLGPTYVLAYDDEEILSGSWRLLPTTGPYMLRDVFPQLLEGRPAPNDRAIWECSRFSVDCSHTRDNCLASINRVTSEMVAGVLDHCLANGVRQVVSVYDVYIARMYPRIGGRTLWQSRPQRIGATSAVAGAFDVSEVVLQTVRSKGGITHAVIRPMAPHRRRQAA